MSEEYTVLSIDVGVYHLGLSVTTLTADFNIKEIIWFDMMDITNYTHHQISKTDCKLHHTKTFSDWLEHLYQECPFFESCDYILIERQPPLGFVVIEQLIFNRFRYKACLISPRNVHTYFNLTNYDYEKRKEHSVQIATSYLSESLKTVLTRYERSHDISDSICIMLYWKDKKQKEYIKKKKIEQLEMITKTEWQGKNVFEKLESFRFKNN